MPQKRVPPTEAVAPAQLQRGRGPEIAYTFVRKQILAMELKPGAKIEERQLVDTLGLSRTPIRQALQRLASVGLVDILPNHGARVAQLGLDEARSFFEAFEAMQAITNHLAARRHTEEELLRITRARDQYDRAARKLKVIDMIDANQLFHLEIARACGNNHFERIMDELLIRCNRLEGVWHNRQDKDNFKRAVERSRHEHDIIVESIAARDSAAAEQFAHTHVASFREPLLAYLDESVIAEIDLRFD